MAWDIEVDDPRDHPLWEEQVAVELDMLHEGRDTFLDTVDKARKRGTMGQLKPFEQAIIAGITPSAEVLREALKGWKRAPHKPVAFQYLLKLPPEDACFIGLHAIVNHLSDPEASMSANRLAVVVGSTIEHELNVRTWAAAEPEAFTKTQFKLDQQGATAGHRYKVNVAKFNALMEKQPELEWSNWPSSTQAAVGITVLRAIQTGTNWLTEEPRQLEPGEKRNPTRAPDRMIRLSDAALDMLTSALERHSLANPVLGPTVIPPKRWTNMLNGGYHTPVIRHPNLIRFKASTTQQKTWAWEDYQALDMPVVYEALHALQETPWRINARVLDVLLACWASDTKRPGSLDKGIGKLPLLRKDETPPKYAGYEEELEEVKAYRKLHPDVPHSELPDDMREKEERTNEWKRQATGVASRNAHSIRQRQRVDTIVQQAIRYRDFEQVYFPHMMDFRGRKYPMAIALQPQGDHIARGLLTFARPMRLGARGLRRLLIHTANMAGFDKATLDGRVAWTMEHLPLIRQTHQDPMAMIDFWSDMDKPWCFLASCFEVGAAYELANPEDYECSLPGYADGTCNGIQHLAAITRDEEAGRLVNLVPQPFQQDIYRVVAEALQALAEADLELGGASAEAAGWWLDICEGSFKRTLTKRQVMVLPYGGSRDAFFKYTCKWLDGSIKDGKVTAPPTYALDREAFKKRMEYCRYLSVKMWDVVNNQLKGPMAVMRWLVSQARATAEAGAPIFWSTPSGFVVRHFYGKFASKKVQMRLFGEMVSLRVTEPTDTLDLEDQLRGVPPNFIHSLDAAALDLTIHEARKRGIRDITTIHDAYGTHMALMDELDEALREAFVQVHRDNALDLFRAGCLRVLTAHHITDGGLDPLAATEKSEEQLDVPFVTGSLDIEAVRKSAYFFA
jgi:DNA-directed RNA polymerase